MLKKILIPAVILGVLVTAFVLTKQTDYQDLGRQLRAGHVIYNPNKPLPDFSLIDHNNQTFNNQNLKDKWTLLLFIYTHCPDVCPTELLDMSLLRRKLNNDNAKAPEVVAITFDPLRDTPEVMKDYITYFNKDFVGVSGEQAQINRLTKPLGIYYERVVEDKNGKHTILKADAKISAEVLKQGYLVNHTAWIYLMAPNGQTFAGFPSPHKLDDMAHDIKLIVDNF